MNSINSTGFSNPFEIDVNIADKITVETAKFLFDQAEKDLSESIKIVNRMTDRCYTFIGILSAVVPVLVGLSVTNKDLATIFIPLSILILVYIAAYAMMAKPFESFTIGDNCDEYVKKEWVEYYTQDDMYRAYLIAMYESVRWKIERINDQNEKRSLRFNKITISLFGILLVTPFMPLFI